MATVPPMGFASSPTAPRPATPGDGYPAANALGFVQTMPLKSYAPLVEVVPEAAPVAVEAAEGLTWAEAGVIEGESAEGGPWGLLAGAVVILGIIVISKITTNVRVEKPCIVGKYKDIERTCKSMGMQAHHIVADYTLRTGNDSQKLDPSYRIPNFPSYPDGQAICLEGQARVQGTEHNEVHFADGPVAAMGATGTPPGTAPIGKVAAAYAAGAIAVKWKCRVEIAAAVNAEFAGVDPSQLARTTQNPPPAGSATFNTLMHPGAAANFP